MNGKLEYRAPEFIEVYYASSRGYIPETDGLIRVDSISLLLNSTFFTDNGKTFFYEVYCDNMNQQDNFFVKKEDIDRYLKQTQITKENN